LTRNSVEVDAVSDLYIGIPLGKSDAPLQHRCKTTPGAGICLSIRLSNAQSRNSTLKESESRASCMNLGLGVLDLSLDA
jgi:hypothetical protein